MTAATPVTIPVPPVATIITTPIPSTPTRWCSDDGDLPGRAILVYIEPTCQ